MAIGGLHLISINKTINSIAFLLLRGKIIIAFDMLLLYTKDVINIYKGLNKNDG